MHFHRAVLTVFMLAWAALYSFNAADAAQNRPFKEGELLVQFKSGMRSSSRLGLERGARVRQSRVIGRGDIHHIVLEPGASVDQALAVYAASPEVKFAEPNYLVRAQALPGDSYFNQQWGLYNSGQVINGYTGTPGADLDALLAWGISSGSTDVVVALVDTGADLNHPDLAANIWTNPGEIPDNGIDDDGNLFIDDVHGWDFSDLDNDPQDGSGHGSHVAGIIGAVGDNTRGIAGVAWQVRIMPLRFMNAFEEGSTADAIKAIEYALDQGVKVINCSWGSYSYSAALRYVIANANALFICAAGNDAADTDMEPFYPASFNEDNIVSVAASDQMDQLTWFSNYGPASVDVAAPGARIFSLKEGRQIPWSENFDAGLPNGWTTGGSGDTWAVADPPAMPGAAALAVSPVDNYVNDANAWVQAPVQDLSTASASQLTFQLIGQSEAYADYLFLEVSTDGSSWYCRPLQMGGTIKYGGVSGSVPYWMTAKADLGPWDGEPQLFLRLRFKSNSAYSGTGFFIDNLQMTTAGQQDSYQFMQGTSMAAGYVSGLAALILSENESLSPAELKTAIENSADLSQHLLEQVASGGRVNAYNALSFLKGLSLTAASAATDRIQLTWHTQVALNPQILIERRTEGQLDFEIVAQVDAGATDSYTDSALAANSTYYYRVQAETQDGRSGYSNQTIATTLGSNGASSIGAAGGSSGGGGCFVTSMTD
jgi:subtilisin family serine protease